MKTLILKMKVKIKNPQDLRDYLDDVIQSDVQGDGCSFCESEEGEDGDYPVHKAGCPAGLMIGIRKAIEGKG